MDILCVRGANLASLADEFEIDFSKDPIRNSGIFAITGPTGAGKSTILDAICLALYGTCPRLSVSGVDEDIPDQSGDFIRSTDARSILRRGAAAGFAEVDFSSSDGKIYRARWTIRRAKDVIDGKLQPVERSLIRLPKGEVIASQIKTVAVAVVEKTDLTYEEFRRGVLLAQGDFDAFLRANTSERAALLEKVTGADVYRKISREVFDRHDKLKSELTQLEAQRAAKKVLSAADREGLLAEKSRLNADISALETFLDALAKDAEVLRNRKTAVDRLNEATASLGVAQDIQSRTEISRAFLSRFDVFASDRDPVTTFRAAQAKRDEAVSALARLSSEISTSEAATQQLLGQFTFASTALSEAETTFSHLEGDIRKAEAADASIGVMVEKLQSLKKKHLTEEERQRSLKLKKDDLSLKMKTLKGKKIALEQSLSEKSHLSAIRENWPAIKGMVSQYIDAQRLGKDAELRKAASVLSHDKKSADALRLAAVISEIEAKITAIEAQADEIAARASNLNPDLAQSKINELAQWRSKSETLKKIVAESNALKASSQMSRDKLAGIRSVMEEIQKKQASLKDSRAIVSDKLDILTKPLSLAEAASSVAAARLRSTLEEDCPCPVCGSKSHDIPAQDEMSKLLAEIKNQHIAIKDELARIDAEISATDQRFFAEKTKFEKEKNAFELFVERRSALMKDYKEILVVLQITPESSLISPEVVESIIADLDQKRENLLAIIGEASTLVQKERALKEEIRALYKERSNRDLDLKAVSLKIEEDARLLALATRDFESSSEAKAKILPIIEESLAVFGFSENKSVEACASLTQSIDKEILSLKQDQEGLVSVTSEILSLQNTLNLVASDHFDAMDRSSLLETECSEVDAALQKEKAHRSGLLDGKSALSVSTFWKEKLSSLRRNKESSGHLYSEAHARSDVLKAQHGELTVKLSDLSTAFTASQKIYADFLIRTGFTEDDILSFESKTASDIQKLRTSVSEAQAALDKAIAVCAQRQLDKDAQDDIPCDYEDLGIVEELISTSKTEMNEKRSRTAAIDRDITLDDSLRSSVSDLTSKILKLEKDVKIWGELNAAIGQRNGGKFVQFAQSITLQALVERANAHLQFLNPRYVLQSGGEDLSLNVMDLDMGSELRSTRSLSGGERFLLSLSLALSLSSLGGKGAISGTLFIDEGFGSLDTKSLDMAMDALERLQSEGRMIGVISHVEAMKARIPVQVRVEKRASGRSQVSVFSSLS